MKISTNKRQQTDQAFWCCDVIKSGPRAQTTIEYLLLLGIITAIVLVGFNSFIIQSRDQANNFFNREVNEIMGEVIDTTAVSASRNNYP